MPVVADAAMLTAHSYSAIISTAIISTYVEPKEQCKAPCVHHAKQN